MDEFIVWDTKLFKAWNGKKFIGNEIQIVNGLDEMYCGDIEELIFFPYIGKTDINDKKIYADSSIVKFEFAYGGKWIPLKAYFQYNLDELRYEAHLVDSPDKNIWSVLSYDMFKFKDLKIIDTIQENKLNLMEKRK